MKHLQVSHPSFKKSHRCFIKKKIKEAFSSIHRLSTFRKPSSLPSNTLSFFELVKENDDTRRPTSIPFLKPIIRSIARVDWRSSSTFSFLPRGRSPSPSDRRQTRRVSVDRTGKDPTHMKSHSNSAFKPSDKLKVVSTNGARVEENTSNSNNKSNIHTDQSKLHEKLAFREGKAKRIAPHIKKTKEMLDLNNPDASKVIISDDQGMVVMDRKKEFASVCRWTVNFPKVKTKTLYFSILNSTVASFLPSLTLCKLNRDLIIVDSLSDDRANQTYGKNLRLVFNPVPFHPLPPPIENDVLEQKAASVVTVPKNSKTLHQRLNLEVIGQAIASSTDVVSDDVCVDNLDEGIADLVFEEVENAIFAILAEKDVTSGRAENEDEKESNSVDKKLEVDLQLLLCLLEPLIHYHTRKRNMKVIVFQIDTGIATLLHNFEFCKNCSLFGKIWPKPVFLAVASLYVFPYENDIGSSCGVYLYLHVYYYYSLGGIGYTYHVSNYGKELNVATAEFYSAQALQENAMCALANISGGLSYVISSLGQSIKSCSSAKIGVVAADDTRCSAVGVSMPRLGGHVVDAAVVMFCTGVVFQDSSGIGDQKQILFESLRDNIPWYSVYDPSSVNKAVVWFSQSEWKYKNNPILVVFDAQGRVESNIKHETHPGVQDMACNNFFKRVQKCKWKFENNSEVLFFFSTIVNNYKATMIEAILEMIETFEDYREHWLKYISLLCVLATHCFPTIIYFSSQQLKLVMDSIMWAFRHTTKNIVETGMLVDFESFFSHTFCHECCHGIEPHTITLPPMSPPKFPVMVVQSKQWDPGVEKENWI